MRHTTTLLTLTFAFSVFPLLAKAQKATAQKATVQKTGKSLGLVVLRRQGYVKPGYIEIYNGDGSVWYKFSFYYDDSDRKFDYENAAFRPFAFHPDYFLLALKCIKRESARYQVIVNEETDLVKYVKVDDPALNLETWSQHVLSAFAVGFDSKRNPPRNDPNGRVVSVAAAESLYLPVRIRGDWLQIKYRRSTGEKYSYAWIRWRRGQSLQIELFYFA